MAEVLFPYYITIRDLNLGKIVYIIEDNVGVHYKARRLLADLIRELDIKFLDTPSNSPDLQLLKYLYKDQKKELEEFRFKTISAAQAVQFKAEQKMRQV